LLRATEGDWVVRAQRPRYPSSPRQYQSRRLA
jgi:hypothetical protein